MRTQTARHSNALHALSAGGPRHVSTHPPPPTPSAPQNATQRTIMPGMYNSSSIEGGELPERAAKRAYRAALTHLTLAIAGIFGADPVPVPKIKIGTMGEHNSSSVEGGAPHP